MNYPIIEELNTDLRAIIQAVEVYSHTTFRHSGITGPQLSVLETFKHRPTANAVDVARQVHLSMATLSGIIVRLEQRGLIERARSDKDRRKADIRLTPAGRHLLATAPPLLDPAFIEAFVHRLPNWEQQMILSALKRLVALLVTDDGNRKAVSRDQTPYLPPAPALPA